MVYLVKLVICGAMSHRLLYLKYFGFRIQDIIHNVMKEGKYADRNGSRKIDRLSDGG